MGTLRSVTVARNGRSAAACAAAKSPLALLPLPCPDPSDEAVRAAPRPHEHRCASCGGRYRCAGADETGFCPPLCAPCYWVELGGQLTAYRAIVSALERKRRHLEKSAGREACARALENRRRGAQLSTARVNRNDPSTDGAAER
ncbi:MAG TPA: hypothetical protein VNF27_14330 [Candidatus Binataceae bacterium]|nr:hypothetical protein [Candidatus Binataceae bacterium]